MLRFTVRGQSIFCDCGFVVSDSVDYLTAFFDFSPDWTGLIKTAQFRQNETVYNVPLTDDRCTVPAEITSGELEISVFAVESGGTKRITTTACAVTVYQSGFCPDGETPIPPTPDLYSELLSQLEMTLEKAEQDYPKSLSELQNDAGFITDEAIPKKLSELDNDSGFITDEAVPKKLSELDNDSGFITDEAIPKKLSELDNDSGFITDEAIPKKLSELDNDSGFVTDEAIPKKLSGLDNDSGFVTDEAIPKKLSGLEQDLSQLMIGENLKLTENSISCNGHTVLNIASYGLVLNSGYTQISGSQGGVDIRGTLVVIDNLVSPTKSSHAVNKKYVDDITGEISTALDSIISIQTALIGGENI